jgi:cytochrome P450
LALWEMIKFFRDPLVSLQRQVANHGMVSRLDFTLSRSSPQGIVLAIGPEYNQQVLSDSKVFHALSPSPPPDTAAQRLTQGVVYLNGEHHRQQRRLIMPAFHKKEVDGYAEDMIAVTQQLMDRWHPGQRVNMIEEMTVLTMGIVIKTLFGLELDKNGHALGNLLEEWLALSNSILANVVPQNLPYSPARRLVAVSERIEVTVRELLAQKRAQLDESRDVMSMLMKTHDEDGTQMTDAELIGNATLLYLAGHETSANALTWALFLLSQHPKVMADLVDEVEGELHGNPPTIEQLSRLKLLEGVINEALRLFPPLSFISKTVSQPVRVGHYDLSAGESVMISHFLTHRLPDLYPQPNRFMPERWFSIDPSPYEYIPFSAGPRRCIGATFAMMEMKIVLAMLLQRYRFLVIRNAQVQASFLFLLRARQMPIEIQAAGQPVRREAIRGNIVNLVELT